MVVRWWQSAKTSVRAAAGSGVAALPICSGYFREMVSLGPTRRGFNAVQMSFGAEIKRVARNRR
jgi:hypothetical protein